MTSERTERIVYVSSVLDDCDAGKNLTSVSYDIRTDDRRASCCRWAERTFLVPELRSVELVDVGVPSVRLWQQNWGTVVLVGADVLSEVCPVVSLAELLGIPSTRRRSPIPVPPSTTPCYSGAGYVPFVLLLVSCLSTPRRAILCDFRNDMYCQ